MRRPFLIPLVLTVLATTACSRPAPQEVAPRAAIELQEVPSPDLGQAEEAVRQQIQGQRAQLEVLSLEDDPRKLGQAYGDLGLIYLTYSFVEAAGVCFDNARALDGDNPRWPYLEGYLHQIQGELEEATAAFERSLALDADAPATLIRLGTVRLELGDRDQARAHFERAIALDPESAAAYDGLGKVAAAAGDTAGAVKSFERALELQPKASSVHHALGLAYRRLGDLELAKHHLARGGDAPVLFADPYLREVTQIGQSADFFLVLGAQAFSEARYEQAEVHYRRALELQPHDFTARKALGFCLEKLGDVDAAVEQLELGLRLGSSGDEERDVLERSELLRILGGLRVLQGREDEGIAAFRRALRLDPTRLDTRSKLANALARRGELGEAVEHYDRILAAKPDEPKVLIQRGTALINLGQSERGLADFRQAVALSPDDPEPRLRLAEALEHVGDAAAAAAQRGDAARLAEGDPKQRSEILADEADKRLQQGDLEGALAGFQQALSVDPENTDARYQMATVLGHQERFDEALAELARVIDTAPHHGPARRAEVTALVLQGRFAEARKRLQQGLEAMPRNRELAHGLARLLATAPDTAVRDGELALRIASRVHQESQRSSSAETLAAALAETGRFNEATELQRRLVASATGSGRGAPSRWGLQLQSYETFKPWRLSSPDEIIQAMAASGSPSPSTETLP